MDEASGTDREAPAEPSTNVRVGVLSFHNSKETKAILNAVRRLGHDPVWLREENTRTRIADGNVRFDPDVDIVVNRLLTTKASQPMDDLGVAMTYRAVRPVLNDPEHVIRAMHKYAAAATLAVAGLPVPEAYMAFAHQTVNDGRPVDGQSVYKPAIGTNGDLMELVEAEETLSPRIAQRQAFVQQFLDTDAERPFDIRVYVVDGQMVGAMKRYATGDEWRTNVARGGEVEGVTERLSPDAVRLATEAANVFGLDYAGVDLLRRSGRWYVLEVNTTAGFKGLFEATGVSPAPHIARLAIERAGGTVDADRVADLATTLDDSVPPCKPTTDAESGPQETVGYTERVVVSGGQRTERAVAKSDTGAQRTCIDFDIAATVGAGPVVDTVRVKSTPGNGRQKRPLVDIDVKLGNHWHSTTASIEDRSHMNYPVLLGRDVLRGYHIDIEQRVAEE